jgi:cytochrome c oxidase subunit I
MTMNDAHCQLQVPGDFRRPLAVAWLMLGIAGIVISGLFVVLIVLSRTPGLEALFPFQGFFHLAIVAHVDFSVLVWFAACGAMIWSLATAARAPVLGWTAFAIAMAGAMLMAAAPFQGGEAIMSNYVPVLKNTAFLAGLALFGLGVTLMAARSLLYPLPAGKALAMSGALRFGSHTSAIAILLSAGALVWSLLALPDYLHGPQYFEALFWGGGHVLQFAWVQLMLVAWLWLAAAGGLRMPMSSRLVTMLLMLGILPAFLGIWAYLVHDVAGPHHRTFFIWLMAAGGGVAAGPIALALLYGWRHSPPAASTMERGLRSALLFSILLMGVGGALGFLINSSNTMVPAHYHGCIVAVTLAFMSLSLHLLPRLGFAAPNPRLVLLMPRVYGVGQILHVTGLAFSGGHGVQRKTAGAEQGLESLAQILGMSVMGLGGLIAITGGVIYLVAVTGTLRRSLPLARPQAA